VGCRYNKQEKEFASKSEYDDYLEEREDIGMYPNLKNILSFMHCFMLR
jgi:hypothetical protein